MPLASLCVTSPVRRSTGLCAMAFSRAAIRDALLRAAVVLLLDDESARDPRHRLVALGSQHAALRSPLHEVDGRADGTKRKPPAPRSKDRRPAMPLGARPSCLAAPYGGSLGSFGLPSRPGKFRVVACWREATLHVVGLSTYRIWCCTRPYGRGIVCLPMALIVAPFPADWLYEPSPWFLLVVSVAVDIILHFDGRYGWTPRLLARLHRARKSHLSRRGPCTLFGPVPIVVSRPRRTPDCSRQPNLF